MANIIRNTLTIEGKNAEVIKNHIIANEEWIEKVTKLNETLEEGFKREVPKVGEIDFNLLIPMPTNIFTGNLGSKEEELYGKKTWFEWCHANWGTKWNAETISFNESEDKTYFNVVFDTPWCPPLPIYWKLIELCKANDCNLYGAFADEYYDNENMGTFSLNDGELWSSNEPSAELFEVVWGYYPCEEDDGEED